MAYHPSYFFLYLSILNLVSQIINQVQGFN